MTAGRTGFVRWRSSGFSGGDRYDTELAAALRELGVDVRDYPLSGAWPLPESADQDCLAALLTEQDAWLVPNIVASAAPQQILAALAAGRRVTLLLHYFPADDIALAKPFRDQLGFFEGELVRATTNIVVTSQWAAGEVARRYGRGDAVVALPGSAPSDPAPGSAAHGEPPALLWLGRVSLAKDPGTFIDALSTLADLPFTARLVGAGGPGDDLPALLRERTEHVGLGDRVQIIGARQGAELEAIWAASDLLVHSSPQETYGMVVAEALAHGIASVVAEGTGAVEAQRGVGATFPSGDATALATILRAWLTDADLRRDWREAALGARASLPTWGEAARAVASALGY